MKGEIVDVPFKSHPMIRTVFEILESHENEEGITIIDKMKIKEIYVVNDDTMIVDEKFSSEFTTKDDKDVEEN